MTQIGHRQQNTCSANLVAHRREERLDRHDDEPPESGLRRRPARPAGAAHRPRPAHRPAAHRPHRRGRAAPQLARPHQPRGRRQRAVRRDGRRAAGRRGEPVTVFCAAHPHAPRDEVKDGVRYVRRGSQLTVYLWAALLLALGTSGSAAWAAAASSSRCTTGAVPGPAVHPPPRRRPRAPRAPRAVAGRLRPARRPPRLVARVLARPAGQPPLPLRRRVRDDPRRARRSRRRRRPASPSSTTAPPRRCPRTAVRTAAPSIVVLGRVVPHKRVELVLQAAARCATELPGLRVDVAGDGYWLPALHDEVARLGLQDVVTLHGRVTEQDKADLLARSWVHAVPSRQGGLGAVGRRGRHPRHPLGRLPRRRRPGRVGRRRHAAACSSTTSAALQDAPARCCSPTATCATGSAPVPARTPPASPGRPPRAPSPPSCPAAPARPPARRPAPARRSPISWRPSPPSSPASCWPVPPPPVSSPPRATPSAGDGLPAGGTVVTYEQGQ